MTGGNFLDRADLLQQEQQRRHAIAQDYLEVFSTEAGQRVLRHIEAENFVGRTTLERPTPTAPVDVHLSAMNEGRRTAALAIKAMILRAKQPQSSALQANASSRLSGKD